MTIPKKSRRTISVDNVKYHWTRGHTRRTENGWVTVQQADGHGSLLRIDLYGIPKPIDISEGIRFAIANGWNPSKSDQMFYLGFTDQPGHKRFIVRSADSPDFWREFVK
ncbi:MAG: hypothetical protein JWP89_3098 [Schlesneria sp.]|nr:hypothetical protein [Schlesneria sp.]